MTSDYGTHFTESEALLAVVNGDYDEARAILAEMLPGELAVLRRHATSLSGLCADVVREQARRAVAEVED